MKKLAAGMAVLATAGFTGLSMAPASAAPFAFDNCDQAYALGVGNIPEGQPGYSRDLDRPYDGVACEGGGFGYDITRVPGYVAPVAPPVTPPVTPDTQTGVFANCTEARAVGAVNIPAADPRYGLHLDRDRDGFGCDADGGDDGIRADGVVVVPGGGSSGQYDQMGQVPVGGADTGVAAEEDTTAGGLALGGGALLVAAGAAVVARRRGAARA